LYSLVTTSIIQGIKSIPVYVEADVSDGMPLFEMVGSLSPEVKESKERVRTALKNTGYILPPKRITINFIPANIRKTGSGFDLPVVAAVLCAIGIVPEEALKDTMVVGEISLSGDVKPVNGILPMVAEAKERGVTRCIVPAENQTEALLVKEIEIFAVQSIAEMIHILNGGTYIEKEIGKVVAKTAQMLDFSDIQGQYFVKRACEVAVSGMHNLLMIGPPGAGKTMTAMRIPTILPPLDEKEQMELSKIYSVSGQFQLREQLMEERPFRCPHHTITMQGLVGGGLIPKPGEISLAHKGVLFLDELPEFKQNTIEILRQPMEEKEVRLVRVNGTYEYPADFILVAAMNPCKCGYYPDMQKCRCTAASIERYINRISQPLLDRIDICVETPQIKFEELNGTKKEECSDTIRERVIEVHAIQKKRYQKEDFQFNSQIPAARIAEYCALSKDQEKYMKKIYKQLNLTARSYHKILKVARTLADMDGSENILDAHLNEAVCYRNIDKRFWRDSL
jgi:magnesium chelatase family protein